MKAALFAAILLVLAVCAGNTVAQSGPPQQPITDGTANQRKPEPTATPTPPTVSTTTAGNSTTPYDGDVIKVNTQLVSIPVRVMDKKGRFVGGLGKEHFQVFEGGVEQDVEIFTNEHEPFTVALVLDMSY